MKSSTKLNEKDLKAIAEQKAVLIDAEIVEKDERQATKSTASKELRELFIESLKDLYWAEKALTQAIAKMAKNANTPKLIHRLNAHLSETHTQIERLEEVFSLLGEKAVAKKCDAMEGLIQEGESIIEETKLGAVRDAGIIAVAQKIEHYEIASYGTLAAWAESLGEDVVISLLNESLFEEKNANAALSEAAYNDINFEAMNAFTDATVKESTAKK